MTARTFFLTNLLILTDLLFIGSVSANPMLFGVGVGSSTSIMVNANWGFNNCANSVSCNVTSATRTISGSGTIKMAFTGSLTHQYSQNGGAFTTFTNNSTLAVSNADTLAFKILAIPSPCDDENVTVTDNSTGAAVGDFTGENSFGC